MAGDLALGLSLLHDLPGEKVSLIVPPGARTGRSGAGDVVVHEASPRCPGST